MRNKPMEVNTSGLVLSMTIRMRINVEAILRAQREEAGGDQYDLILDMRDKIGFTDDDRALYLRDQPGGGARFMAAVADATPALDVTLDKAEMRKLVTILKKTPLGTDDELWFIPLRARLKELQVW